MSRDEASPICRFEAVTTESRALMDAAFDDLEQAWRALQVFFIEDVTGCMTETERAAARTLQQQIHSFVNDMLLLRGDRREAEKRVRHRIIT